MSQRPDTPFSASAPEAVSAYLSGELEGEAAEAFEARLASEPALAARLDALHEALLGLGGLDDMTPPEGFEERLRARLDAESAVVDLGAVRRTRAHRWSTALTGAAAAVVMAVAGLQVLGRTGMDGPSAGLDMAMEEADEDVAEQAALESAAPESLADGETGSTESRAIRAPEPMAGGDGANSAGGSGTEAYADSSQDVASPVITDEGAMLATDDDLRAHFGARPEADRWRGTPRQDAEPAAAEHAARVREAPPFADGTSPGACLEQALKGEAHRVVVRVERVHWQGAPALAYLTMTARPGSAVLDQAELWLGEPDGCQAHRDLVLG